MYHRISSGYRIDWEPDDEANAEQAMQDEHDPGFTAADASVELDAATAQAVRERYEELITV